MRLAALLMVLGATGCAHVATLRPAEKGALEVELTAGGPVVKQGTVAIPASLTSLGARYGIHERVDVQAHFHPTAALLGVLGLDVGTSVLAVKGHKGIPDVTATARLFAFTDFRRTFEPNFQLGAVASWRLFNRIAPYLGVDVMGAGPHFGVAAGLQGTFGRFTVQLEGKWFVVGDDVRSRLVEWLSPNDIGTFGVQLGVGYRFGRVSPSLP